MSIRSLFYVSLCLILFSTHAYAGKWTKVFINGVATPVNFNDGDSFKIQAGSYKGIQARLSHYNTLESFGPVHRWGTWSAKELYQVGKMATQEARRGVWHCTGDGKTDTYGRLLLFCKDLALHLIKKGLAQAYSIDSNPGDPDLVAAQREAMAHRRGLWAHGIPQWVMTSAHSTSEGGGSKGETSNRLISTWDARSRHMTHNDNYNECQQVCHMEKRLSDLQVEKALQVLKSHAALVPWLNDYSDDDLKNMIRYNAQLPEAVLVKFKAHEEGFTKALNELRTQGLLNPTNNEEDSCFVYTHYQRRFGGEQAACLR